jgi:predicted oxidoreductase
MPETLKLSENGPRLSRIVAGVMKWGAWGRQLNTQQMLRLIEQGVELGVSTFDHADIYGHYTTEAEFGAALKLQPALREKMQIITKCGINLVTPNRPRHKIKSYDTSATHIVQSVERSLKHLHTDYIDLLLIHRPDLLLNPDEVAETFSNLRQAGKVKYFGVSNFSPGQFAMLNSSIELVTNQVEASLLHLDPFTDGTFDQCLQHRIKPMVWSPLGGGAIFNETKDERVLRIRRTAHQLAQKHNAGLDQILLAWLLRHPARLFPVLGTARVKRMEAAVAALRIELTREEWYELWQASTGAEVA